MADPQKAYNVDFGKDLCPQVSDVLKTLVS